MGHVKIADDELPIGTAGGEWLREVLFAADSGNRAEQGLQSGASGRSGARLRSGCARSASHLGLEAPNQGVRIKGSEFLIRNQEL